ncbi:hypothetical protein CISIN_1g0079541mg, partial [Citrus sinensis]
RVEKLKKLMGA